MLHLRPLLVAFQIGHNYKEVGLVKLLLDNNVDVNGSDHDGASLYAAAHSGHTEESRLRFTLKRHNSM